MRIGEEYQKSGFFWLPEDEENKLPGTLSISEGGRIELEVVGYFHGIKEVFNNEDIDIERILGHVEKDGLVTLENCFYIKTNFAFDGVSKSTIFVHKVLSGAIWSQGEIVTFNTFSFAVDYLDEWLGITGITIDNDWKQNNVTVHFELPERRSFYLDNGMSLEVCFACSIPSIIAIKEATITQRAYFRLVSEEECKLDEFTSVAFKIVNLMCFAMDEVVVMQDVSATSSELQRTLNNGEQYPEKISIYYQSIPYSEKTPKIFKHKMLFTFKAIENNAQRVFNNWLNAYEYLSPALGLYFSIKVDAHKYFDGKFLALAQGLETYHRRTSSETLMAQEDFDNLVSEILAKCPKEHTTWLRDRLHYGNELSLRQRIKKIIEPFKTHFGSNKERKELITSIVNTRNYLTHYEDSLKEYSAKGGDLWILCLRMEAIFNLHFLKMLGFTDEEINQIIKTGTSLQEKLEHKL